MKEEIRNECLRRMERLNLSKQCINAFKRNEIWESEGIGALYEINDNEKEIVKEFETKNPGYKVYHMIHTMTEFGELYSMLYVGPQKSEWKYFNEDLDSGITFAYVHNNTDSWLSEFGSIGIKSNIGGLIRTY